MLMLRCHTPRNEREKDFEKAEDVKKSKEQRKEQPLTDASRPASPSCRCAPAVAVICKSLSLLRREGDLGVGSERAPVRHARAARHVELLERVALRQRRDGGDGGRALF